MRLIIALAALLLLSAPAAARDNGRGETAAPEDRDILPFQRVGILEGVAMGDQLWLRGAGLSRLDLKSGTRTDLYDSGVIDIASDGEQLWMLRRTDEQTIALMVFAGDGPPQTRASWKALEGEQYIGLLATPGTYFVVSRQRILAYSAWGFLVRERPLRGLRARGQPSGLAMTADGSAIYVGFNAGEWGGELDRIDLGNSRVDVLPALGPVTGLIADDTRPDCVLASVGLAHMVVTGGIHRACGKKARPLASWPLPDEPSPGAVALPGQTLPIFGLARAGGQVWAVTYGLLIQVGGQPEMRDLPDFATVDGIELSRPTDGVLVVKTTMNASFSLSGATPLLVPLE